VHFEPTAGNPVDALGARQAKLSFRPELKAASGHVSPESFASPYGHKDAQPGANVCFATQVTPKPTVCVRGDFRTP
jgi:hypothetical protein